MTVSEQLAAFVVRASFDDLSVESRRQLKIRVLDALGCAIGALTGEPILRIQAHVDEFGGPGRSTLIGGGTTAPDRAAFYNSALVRYLDFNDSTSPPEKPVTLATTSVLSWLPPTTPAAAAGIS